jgi:MoxR-like ATPase
MNDLETLKETLSKIREETGKVIIGHQEVIDLALVAIFSGSHALIEGVPGIAKTLMVRTFGKVLGGRTQRIQFTPDLMPADITGTNVYNQHESEFKLLKGPVFTDFLLADEINRAPAKTQSALLQCMQERKVTIDRESHELSGGFTVFATQNPIEFEGTYPLPEAQKDRFLLKINMGYPEEQDEKALALMMLEDNSPEKKLESGEVKEAISFDSLPELQSAFAQIKIKDELVDYIIKIIRLSRTHGSILVGAGPRATQALVLSSRVYAAISGRDFVTPDDIKFLAVPVLSHRLALRPEYEIEGLTVSELIKELLEEVPVPR